MVKEQLNTRKELRHGRYHAIAVEAYSEGFNQTNICKSYLEMFRDNPEPEMAREFAAEIDGHNKKACKCPSHRCHLFATNAGDGIYIQPENWQAIPPDCAQENGITNYSFVLISDGCKQMDECVTELENGLGLKERNPCMGYRDDEVRRLVESRLG